ncbi:tetratricopeptide repeat protein [Tautonia sociabilis]|uniref:Tetratricopeptide repeat protein n=1 Tax=Tautonia sociabilis TaxID=2080755 RepID=A0A432MMB4_9BACT|nr:tetratricopeptide repeat protein [Tautonia sociabilis]RUL88583.1 tetratricopeptide repeat protein [Tautonia sociabilis]
MTRRMLTVPTTLIPALALLPLVSSSGCVLIPGPREAAEPPALASASPIVEGMPKRDPAASQAVAPAAPIASETMPALTPDRTARVHLDLGRVFEAKGELDAAEAEYRKAVSSLSRKVDRDTRTLAHRRLAGILDRQGKFAASAEHHEAALDLAPRDARAWNDAGYSAYLQGNWDEAISRLRKAQSLDPDDPRILTNLGLALAASGQVDEALPVLDRAGGPVAARANLGYILAATGRTDEARDRYLEALRLNPDHTVARLALGQLDATITPRPVDSIASAVPPPSRVDPAVSPASFFPTEPEPGPSSHPASLLPRLPGAGDSDRE